MVESKRVDWAVVLTTTLLALYVDLGILNKLITSILPISSLMNIAYPLIILFLIILPLFFKNVSNYQSKKSAIFIAAFLLIWYLMTTIIINTPRVSIFFFIVYTIFPLTIPSLIKIDGKLFLKEIMILPCWGIFFLNNLLSVKTVETAESGSLMGLSYTLLVPIVANIIYLFFYFHNEQRNTKIATLLFCLPNIAYTIQIFLFGSRGPFLTILFLPLLLFVVNRKQSNVRLKWKLLTFVGTVFSLIYFNFIMVLESISRFGESVFHVNFAAIDKFLYFHEKDMIDNGRNSITGIAIEAIGENPLGHGLDQFYNNTGLVYPHNFIVQILYDFGVIIGSIFLIFLISKMVETWNNSSYNSHSVFLFLFFISVPSALVSHDLWEIGLLWLFFGFLLSKKIVAN